MIEKIISLCDLCIRPHIIENGAVICEVSDEGTCVVCDVKTLEKGCISFKRKDDTSVLIKKEIA